ncbi:hypothetical protein Btru_065034 [Bulinus truncatus]|nr:hypothetical protein Btru_065034 [Bulinus truncatus]
MENPILSYGEYRENVPFFHTETEEGDIDDWKFADSFSFDKHRSIISSSDVAGDFFDDRLAVQEKSPYAINKITNEISSLHISTHSKSCVNYSETFVHNKNHQCSNLSGSTVTNAQHRQNGETTVLTNTKIGQSLYSDSKYIKDNENKLESSESSKQVELCTPHRQLGSVSGDECVVLKPMDQQLTCNSVGRASYHCDSIVQSFLSDSFPPLTENTLHLGKYDSYHENLKTPVEGIKHMLTRKRSSDDKELLNEGQGVVQYQNLNQSQADNKKLKMIPTEDDFHHPSPTDEHKRQQSIFKQDTSLQMHVQEEDNDWFNESEVAKWFAEMEH